MPPIPFISAPDGPLSTGGRPLPEGVQNGTYRMEATEDGTLLIDITEFVGWWQTEKSRVIAKVREAQPKKIKLFIASTGGFFEDGLAIHDFLKGYDAEVESEVISTTASAATTIALAADSGKRRMSANALYLIHYVRGGIFAFGTVEDVERAADEAIRGHRKMNSVALGIYEKATGKSRDDLDSLMRLEEWLTAEEALAWGLIDEIFEPGESDDDEEMQASARFAAVAHAPAPTTIQALGLPALPQNAKRKPAVTLMPDPTKTPTPTPKPPEAAGKPDPSSDTAALMARIEALEAQSRSEKERADTLEAQNKTLAESRRKAALAAMKQAWTGKLPGSTVEALAELAEKADSGTHTFEKPISGYATQSASVIERLTALAADVPALTSLERRVETGGDGATEDAELLAKAGQAL